MGIKYVGIGAAVGIAGRVLSSLGSVAPWAAVAGIMAAFFLPQLVLPLIALAAVAVFGKWAVAALGIGVAVGGGFGHFRQVDYQRLASFGTLEK